MAYKVLCNLASSFLRDLVTTFLHQAKLFPASRGTCAYAFPFA